MQEQKWLQLRVPATAMPSEAFARLAAGLKAAATAEEVNAASGKAWRLAWFDVEDDIRRQRARIAAACLLSDVAADAVHLVELGDDWQSAWQQAWQAMPIGARLWVRPSFREAAPAGRIDIVLDPGMAFGTGTHATTRLCLEGIERICTDTLPASMLDMGAGSGLLAIAAAKLGVSWVVAVDNDPECIMACRRNAAINDVHIEAKLAERPPAATFDLAVANILARPLIDMAPQLAACAGKQLILSGLLQEQIGEVCRAYEACGLVPASVETMDEWAAIILTRP